MDSSGSVKNSYYYDPYGLSLNKSEAVSNPWQFASGYLDTNTGLYKFGTRYYDPQVGRWTQKDPKGGGYVYANNLPNMLVDPSGRFSIYPLVYYVFGLPIPYGVSVIISQSEAQEASGGVGLLASIIIDGLSPPFVPVSPEDVFLKIRELNARCGALGIEVNIQFGGNVDGSCLAAERT